MFAILFNWSLRECCVPSVWKNSVICPIPKKKNPSSLNDYRPVTLTSIVMKCFEKLVLRRLLTFTNKHLDPLQFAYKPHRGIDDAIFTVLHNAFLHLDKAGSYVRILFIDFSSAFNTIQPHLLALKLLHLDVNPKLILWIVNFLLHRTLSAFKTLYHPKDAHVQVPLKVLSYPLLCSLCIQMTVKELQKHLLLNTQMTPP